MASNIDLFEEEVPHASEIIQFVGGLAKFAEEIKVNCESSFQRMTGIYRDAREWEKLIEARRKEANAPDQSRINARNDKAKELTEPLKALQGLCKHKIGQYQEAIEKMRVEEEERALTAAALFDEPMPYIAPVTKLRGDRTTVTLKEEKRFRVIDLEKVPKEYFVLDEDKIKKMIKAGIGEIPGIEIYIENTTKIISR